MICAVASGKGGTGKTTVAAALARVAGAGAVYVDCDVEEPNGHLFLRPTITRSDEVTRPAPRIDPTLCTQCGACSEACRFGALAVLPTSVIVFDELCHSCGGCELACPEGAIHEQPRSIGTIEIGNAGVVRFVQGRMRIGEAMSPPLIREVKRQTPPSKTIIIDSPPGATCPVIAAVEGADVCILVTEPTPFGLSDLESAVELVQALAIPLGIVINRDGIGDDGVERFCAARGLPVLARIAESRRIATAYASGNVITDSVPELVREFARLLDDCRALAKTQTSREAS